MSEEKKCIKSEELCEGKKALSQEALEQVAGGHAMGPKVKEVIGSAVEAVIIPPEYLDKK